jgi:type 1 fimbria pilin
MQRITLALLLFLSALGWAAGDPNATEYAVNVHVSSSSVVLENHAINSQQQLSVVIDGKKYELRSEIATSALLALGDYKAKLVQDEHKTAYDSLQVYEFLLPDRKTRKFRVVGQTE